VAVLTAIRKIIPCISRMPVGALSASPTRRVRPCTTGIYFRWTCPVTARTMQGMARVYDTHAVQLRGVE